MCGSSKRHILSLNGCVVLPYFCQSGSLVFHFSALFLSCWSHADAVCTPHTYHTHHTHTHTHTPCTHIHAHRAHTYTHTVHTHSTHGKLHTQLYTHSTHPPTYTHTLCTPTYIYTPNTMHTHSTPLPPHTHTTHLLLITILLYCYTPQPMSLLKLSSYPSATWMRMENKRRSFRPSSRTPLIWHDTWQISWCRVSPIGESPFSTSSSPRCQQFMHRGSLTAH